MSHPFWAFRTPTQTTVLATIIVASAYGLAGGNDAGVRGRKVHPLRVRLEAVLFLDQGRELAGRVPVPETFFGVGRRPEQGRVQEELAGRAVQDAADVEVPARAGEAGLRERDAARPRTRPGDRTGNAHSMTARCQATPRRARTSASIRDSSVVMDAYTDRVQLGLGWWMFDNMLFKTEYVTQRFRDFTAVRWMDEPEFSGFLIEGSHPGDRAMAEAYRRAAAKFDYAQLRHWQKEAVARLSAEEFLKWIGPELPEGIDAQKQALFVTAVRANVELPSDAKVWAKVIFGQLDEWQPQALAAIKEAGEAFFGAASGDPQPDWVNLDKVGVGDGEFRSTFKARHKGNRRVRVVFSGDKVNTGAKTTKPMTIYRVDKATWYGPGFYGNTTACGKTLTQETLGVAHRTLPCGTEVSILYNGRTITVPVIDRGPYSHANWDLTSETAERLGFSGTDEIGVTK